MDKFEDVRHNPLKAYNRYMMACNILEQRGRASTEDYINQFSQQEIKDIKTIHDLILKVGRKVAVEMVTKGLEFRNS